MVRFEHIKDFITSASELGLDPCADNNGVLVGVTDEKQVACLHGELLPAGGDLCHGYHRPEWRADFATVDVSMRQHSSSAALLQRSSCHPSLSRKEKIYKACLFS
jgi:hypothetical protein